ncbi:MAG: DUF86 domain-containing protein [Candidatus Omnitrophica bacterium]|nr:DUF86 domain-containing protein [Candidatus Omnitrophota bacterium]
MSRRNDADSLRDMLDAAKEAVSFVRGKKRVDLDGDRKLVLALVRLVEIIGEAAGNVTKEFQAAHPEIPWPVIVGMRNRLAHAYFDIDLDRVWDTVKEDLPPLIAQLEKVVTAK